jgi:hypothetical protein
VTPAAASARRVSLAVARFEIDLGLDLHDLHDLHELRRSRRSDDQGDRGDRDDRRCRARDGDSPEARLPVLRQPLPVDVLTLGVNKT